MGVPHSQVQVGVPPFQVQVGVPTWGYPFPGPGGTPSQVQAGGTPFPGPVRGLGVPPPGKGVSPCAGQIPGLGYTLPEQHSVYLLRGGRYASCVHAGGLSCFTDFTHLTETHSFHIGFHFYCLFFLMLNYFSYHALRVNKLISCQSQEFK